jgi:hypothetical protein
MRFSAGDTPALPKTCIHQNAVIICGEHTLAGTAIDTKHDEILYSA